MAAVLALMKKEIIIAHTCELESNEQMVLRVSSDTQKKASAKDRTNLSK